MSRDICTKYGPSIIFDYEEAHIPISEIAQKYNISFGTAYKIIAREYCPGLRAKNYVPRQHTAVARTMTDAQAREARCLHHEQGATMTELAARFGVTDSAIKQCLRGDTYRDAGGPVGIIQRRLPLQPGQAATVKELHQRGLLVAEIMRETGLSRYLVNQALEASE